MFFLKKMFFLAGSLLCCISLAVIGEGDLEIVRTDTSEVVLDVKEIDLVELWIDPRRRRSC